LHFLRDAGFTIGDELDDPDREAPQASDILRAVTCADATAILIEIPINHIVAAIFDRPVTAVYFKDALCFLLHTSFDEQQAKSR